MWIKSARKLGLLLAFLLTFASIGNTAYAAPDTGGSDKAGKVLTGLRITDLEVPAPGKALDGTARVISAEGVNWQIPVAWVDENGTPAVVAKTGKKYYPTFTFFFPPGYKAAEADSSGKVSIKLPGFLTEMYGTDDLLYVADTSTGLTYISYAGKIAGNQAGEAFSKWIASIADELDKLSDEQWQQFAKELELAVQREAEEAAAKAQGSHESREEAPAPDLVAMYCAQSAIEKYDRSFLEWFAGYIKDTVQPKAVNYIVEKFPLSFGSAVEDEELSNYIGLYIYDVTGNIDGYPAVPDALAYVQGDYTSDDREDFAQIVAINTKTLTEQDEEGNWRIKESEEDNFINTVVHEMFHAFMNDYTRFGMYRTIGEGGTIESGQGFPNWFVEGSASAVENVYQYRINMFSLMANNSDGNLEYTLESVRNGYTDETLSGDERLNLRWCDDRENTGSAYVAGYLATLYMANLQAVVDGNSVIIDKGETYDINIDNLRSGLDHILKRLHGDDENSCESMDTIIRDISGYQSTADFAESFISGENEGEEGSSLYFTTCYLAWLNSKTYIDGGNYVPANGSIMNQAQDYKSQLTDDISADNDIYMIPLLDGMILSTVEDSRASATGGTTMVGPNSEDDQNRMDVAAKVSDETVIAPPKDDTADAPELPVDEPVAEEVPALPVNEPVTEDIPELPINELVIEETQEEPESESTASETPEEPVPEPTASEIPEEPVPEPAASETPEVPATEPAASGDSEEPAGETKSEVQDTYDVENIQE